MRSIEVSEELYSKLESLAVGFDTPDSVIRRLIEGAVSKPSGKPVSKSHVSTNQKDKTKYAMGGNVLAKNRLVLAVVTKYVEDNPGTSFEQLQKAFPKSLQGSMGVFSSESDAMAIVKRTGHKRHFVRPQELVTLSDGKVAVSTQWGAGNIERFVEHARKLGFEIFPSE